MTCHRDGAGNAGGASEEPHFGGRGVWGWCEREGKANQRQMAKGKRQKCVGFALRGPLFHWTTRESNIDRRKVVENFTRPFFP